MRFPKGSKASKGSRVSLRPITKDTVRTITRLEVAPEQRAYVASNAESLAEANFHPEAWYRGIYLGNEPVGFVMLYDETLRDEQPEVPAVSLWRFMVAAPFQRRGIGKAALEQVIEHVRTRPKVEMLFTTCVQGEGSPEPFFVAAGFEPTGEVEDDEVVLALDLED
jgi:diamine N-acetyltransferase